MSAVEYLPGDRWLISGPTAAVHLAGETAAALRWWPRVRDGVTARELVTFLHQDGVLFSSDPFAIVVVEGKVEGRVEGSDGGSAAGSVDGGDAVRVIVGGDTVVLVEDAAGRQFSVTGRDLLTWSERVIPDAAVVYVNCTTLPAAGDLLPMPAGVVRADVVRWALGNDRRTQPEPAQTPLAQVPPVELEATAAASSDAVDGEMPDDELSGGEVPDVGAPDRAAADDRFDDVVGDDVVGDDAITLIGVVPVAETGPDAADDADAGVPQFVVPEQDFVGAAASDPEDLELEQTAVTPDPDEPEQVEVLGGADVLAALDAPHPLEETISHDEGARDHAAEQEPPVAELPGEVTQTVPPEDIAEHGDSDGGDPADDDLDGSDLGGNDLGGNDAADGDLGAADADSGDLGDADAHSGDLDDRDPDTGGTDAPQPVGNGGSRPGPLAGSGRRNSDDPLPANPFPRMSLPPFVPPSAPGFITSATPGAPTRAPFAPPPYPAAVPAQGQDGPVGAATIRDVPRPSGPPPFVPASTTLPPISAVPGQVPSGSAAPAPQNPAEPDAVATGIPPMPPPVDAADRGTALPADGGQGASPDDGADSRAGDHDGHTVLAESLPEDHRPPAMPAEPGPGQVYASLCPAGHPNAPYAGDCRVCGAPIPAAEPVLVQKPTMAVLRMSSGAVIELDRRVIVGRAPSVSRVASADVPHLVTVASPHGDVSRSHVEVQVDDWHIVVTDLNSTNGTEIHAPGRPVQLLRAGAGVVVEIGWQIDLGDGAGFLVDHL